MPHPAGIPSPTDPTSPDVYAPEGIVAYISIFGVLSAKVYLALKGGLLVADSDRLFVVNYRDRTLREFSPAADQMKIEAYYASTTPGEWFR